MPALSIVIPLFNKVNSVARAIESVLQQKFTDFELIVVNDGSTDNSTKAVAQFSDPRIKLIDQPNQGVAVARNRGVSEAKNAYVAFLDADDCYHPEFLQRIAELVSMYPDAALYSCRFNIADETGRIFTPKGIFADGTVGELPAFLSDFKRDRTIIHPSCMAVNKSRFLACGGFPEGKKVGEDLQLILRMSLLGAVVHDHSVLATIHRDAENRTHHRLKAEPACHLQYFLTDDNWQQNISEQQIAAVHDFVRHNTLLHIAGAALLGQRSLARYYCAMLWQQSPRQSIAGYCISIAPKAILHWLKRRRNSA
ncbi:glycosyltransferase family 2 protein [Rheinheimera sp. D18]|uniref:glycosyltransferase family 2 protein n=1 Tax=Rheinheimera sp. D18 TaxID=2545632 RepID=UPI001046B8ED|nr:glycosyltransferase family A protein [Rheinheimera sp. D18]QBL09793.1 glycosyltransferase family 2 protein [Rheinheimera sp. D18]